ncbi:regucalcin-like isoform X1 [Leptidea sinapis]|uniref:regucalcin-like isoform X1 n=1 Tax=Leptidea sinapis TaxID=189913 RepID=UPI0021C3B5BF|nr:regucalcin-like isoform X1 [Leptidea sinapis]XP_050678725.1 regucalcin-like isoform X1 [Leptidea sinapis]
MELAAICDPVLIGEGPHWDEKQQCLYFVSVLEGSLHKYVPVTGEKTKTNIDGRVGFIVPVDGAVDQFVIGVGRTFQRVEWNGSEGSEVKVVEVIGDVDQGVAAPTAINDGKADPRGRLFGGTMNVNWENSPHRHGSLYRIDNNNIYKLCDNIQLSNGLAWDLREKAMYYTDSTERKIRRYDYDVDTGDISNKQFIFDFEKNHIGGMPDGITIDSDGNLWIAVFNGSCVIKIDPRSGKLLQKIPIPAKQVTSVIFGGQHYDVLFVTSARLRAGGPQCGCTFTITGLGVKGLPGYKYKIV